MKGLVEWQKDAYAKGLADVTRERSQTEAGYHQLEAEAEVLGAQAHAAQHMSAVRALALAVTPPKKQLLFQ